MQVLYGNLDKVLPTVFTGVTAYGFLVFSSLYTPCIAALATMRKEYGNKGEKYQYWLSNIEGIGPATIKKLMQYAGSAEELYHLYGYDTEAVLNYVKSLF